MKSRVLRFVGVGDTLTSRDSKARQAPHNGWRAVRTSSSGTTTPSTGGIEQVDHRVWRRAAIAHAVAHALRLAEESAEEMLLLVCLSGRGDKDLALLAEVGGDDRAL